MVAVCHQGGWVICMLSATPMLANGFPGLAVDVLRHRNSAGGLAIANGWPPRSSVMINDLWYKNAIIYCLSVGTYMDANGDGVGDFAGLLRRLDYLQGMGVTALWLMPFQKSPGKDDGYDIADYYSVDPRYGTLGDF